MSDYETPTCCEDFMRVVNSSGNTSGFPKYFTFHCDRCGKLKVLSDNKLDMFEVNDVEE